MKKNISLLLVLMMIFTLLITGCEKQDDNQNNKGDVKTNQNENQNRNDEKDVSNNDNKDDTEKEVTKLEMMHWWAYVTDEILDQFEEEKGVTIDNQYVAPAQYQDRLKLLSATNELPDVFGIMGPDVKDFVNQDLVEEVSSLLEEKAYDQDKSFMETIEPSLLASARNSLSLEQKETGANYGVPFGAISVAVVYNKTIFEEVGIKEPRTWDEFLDNNDKLKDAGYIPLSFTGKNWGDWWYRIALEQHLRDIAVQEDFVSGKAKFTDQEVIDGFNEVKTLWNRGHFDPGGFTSGIEESQALFVQGKLAQFYVVPENFIIYLVENTPEKYEIAAFPLPSMVDGIVPKGLGGAPNSLYLNKETQSKETSGELIKYMISETVFGKLANDGVVPSLTGYQPPEGDLIMKAFADATAGGFIVDPYPTTSEFNKYLKEEAYPEFLLTDKDTEEFVKDLQVKFEDMVLEK